MFIRCSLFFVVLMISWPVRACCLTYSYNLLSDQQTKACPSDGIPVCGVKDKQLVLFANVCLFNVANKDIRPDETKVFRKIPLRKCIYGCKFSCPKTYQPVCVRNIKTQLKRLFANQCELIGHLCKTNMDYLKIGLDECLSKARPQKLNKILEKRAEARPNGKRPVPCTNVFKPVCGSYMGVKSSFKNECLLNAENIALNRNWRIVKNGMCPEDFAKTRRRKDNPAKGHSVTKRSYNGDVFNKYQALHEYDENLDDKSELNVSPNGLYVFMPPTFDNEFLNYNTPRYQHSTRENKIYDQLLEDFETLKPAGISFIKEEETKEEIGQTPSGESAVINPTFAINKANLNYLSDQNLAHMINRQSVSPSIKSVSDEDQNSVYYSTENEGIEETTSTIKTPIQKTQFSEVTAKTNSGSKIFDKQKEMKRKGVKEKKTECKFGSVAICATLANSTVRTFDTLCEMMAANVYLKDTWEKLHDGPCEDCKRNCLREYQPVCVSRNGVNYTMINECYYNMGICMDKKSKWQKLSNNKCERNARISDKYANSEPGFPYTSNYFVSTTVLPASDSSLRSLSTESLEVKSSRYEKARPNTKRSIRKRNSDHRYCSRSHYCNKFDNDSLKYDYQIDITESTNSFPEHHTESYVMSFVRERDAE